MPSERPDPPHQTVARNTRPFLKGLGLALSVIVPILVVTASTGSDPTSAGERAGELSVAPLLGGLAVGVWAKLATRRWHRLDYLLRFVICTIVLFGLNAFGRRLIPAEPPFPSALAVDLTESEKQDLRVRGGWVGHSTFGFVLPVGNQFSLAPGLQDEMNRRRASVPGTFVWALGNEAGDRLVTVFVAKGLGDDERAFRSLTRAIGASTGKQAVQVLAKTRCLPAAADRNPPYVNVPYIVCVQTFSRDSTDLDDARLHLKVPSKDPFWKWR